MCINASWGAFGASVYFQKMSSRCSVHNVLNAQMYLKVLRCLRQGAWGTLSAIKHTLWGSNAPALLCPALLLILVSVSWAPHILNKEAKRAESWAETRGKRIRCRWAQLEPPPPLSMQFCETLHDQVLNSAVWTHIWLPQHRCYSQPEEIWARGGRHHRTISEWTRMKLQNCVKIACSLCEKCETRWTHGICTIPQNYQMNANTCCQLYLLTNINPSQMNY